MINLSCQQGSSKFGNFGNINLSGVCIHLTWHIHSTPKESIHLVILQVLKRNYSISGLLPLYGAPSSSSLSNKHHLVIMIIPGYELYVYDVYI